MIHLQTTPPLVGEPRQPETSRALELDASTGSAGWNPLDDEFEEILDGAWAVIRTDDGWEIKSQHSQSTYPLKSTDMESAKIEGAKLAREIENRFQPNTAMSHERSELAP